MLQSPIVQRPVKSRHLWVKVIIGGAIIALAAVMRWKNLLGNEWVFGGMMAMGGYFISQRLLEDIGKVAVELVKAWRAK
jgi:hypothetical protein